MRLPITPLLAVAATAGLVTTPAIAKDTTDSSPQASSEVHAYTWNELVELIPDLRDMKLIRPKHARAAGSGSGPMLCKREAQIGSRIVRRKCYTLEEYLRKRMFEIQYTADFMQGNDLRLR